MSCRSADVTPTWRGPYGGGMGSANCTSTLIRVTDCSALITQTPAPHQHALTAGELNIGEARRPIDLKELQPQMRIDRSEIFRIDHTEEWFARRLPRRRVEYLAQEVSDYPLPAHFRNDR